MHGVALMEVVVLPEDQRGQQSRGQVPLVNFAFFCEACKALRDVLVCPKCNGRCSDVKKQRSTTRETRAEFFLSGSFSPAALEEVRGIASLSEVTTCLSKEIEEFRLQIHGTDLRWQEQRGTQMWVLNGLDAFLPESGRQLIRQAWQDVLHELDVCIRVRILFLEKMVKSNAILTESESVSAAAVWDSWMNEIGVLSRTLSPSSPFYKTFNSTISSQTRADIQARAADCMNRTRPPLPGDLVGDEDSLE